MFNVVNTVILKPLPFPDSDRLVVVAGTAPGSDLPERFNPGIEFYLHYKEQSRLIDRVFVFGGVVVISHQLWQTWFAGDSAVIGRSYFVSGEMRQIIGVMPPERSMVQLSFTMLTLSVVSGLALILGGVGLYSVLAYLVTERTREIGLRMALGATPGTVQKMVVVQGARVVIIGALIGIAAALASTRALGSMVFGIKTVDPAVFLAMTLMLVTIGMAASFLPARRASRVDPIESLRSD